MTVNGISVIDCDGHVMESIPELAEFMDPSIQKYGRFDRSFIAGIPVFPSLDGIHYSTTDQVPERRPRVDASENRVGSAEDWIALLDETGLERSVMFTSEGLAVGFISRPEYAIRLCRAYNDYVHHRFRKIDNRLHPMALIPMQDPKAAAAELRRAVVDLNLPGAMIPSTGLPLHAGHESYWPVYEAAAELDCVLAWHGGSNRGIGLDTFTDLRASRFLHHPVPLMYAFISLVYSGVFDRYPNFRASFMEGGAGWAVFLLDRAEREEEFFGPPKPRIPELLTSGRVLFGCEGNDMALPYLAKLVGMQAFAYSSDYPHESDMLDVKHEVEETLENPELSQEDKAALLGGSARSFFKL